MCLMSDIVEAGHSERWKCEWWHCTYGTGLRGFVQKDVRCLSARAELIAALLKQEMSTQAAASCARLTAAMQEDAVLQAVRASRPILVLDTTYCDPQVRAASVLVSPLAENAPFVFLCLTAELKSCLLLYSCACARTACTIWLRSEEGANVLVV